MASVVIRMLVVVFTVLLAAVFAQAADYQVCGRKCNYAYLRCPNDCPSRTYPGSNGKACYIDCDNNCKATCRRRVPDCHGYGALCYDPRFIGGDGIMFYFHGQSNKDFCIVSDKSLHINAHFIGKRPAGRPRDFTWVQGLGIMYGTHKFGVSANKVAQWADEVDQLALSYDGQELQLPTGHTSMWTSPAGEMQIERIGQTNSVFLLIKDVMTLSISVKPITQKDSQIHSYEIGSDDCFAHLDLQFNFFNLSRSVDGVLGQTYQPEFKTPVKVGVPMPIMGGDEKYISSSLFSTDCMSTKFSTSSSAPSNNDALMNLMSTRCATTAGAGMVCRR